MSSLRWWLPSEVWLQVLGFLGPGDRLRVRAVCKDFRELVDSGALWTNWTVRLRTDTRVYDSGFWDMLRRWRVTSAVLTSNQNWTDISCELPQLTTLIQDYNSLSEPLQSFQCFTNLQRLHLKRPKRLSLGKLFPLLPPELTHLSICDFEEKTFYNEGCYVNISDFTKAIHLKNLRTFVCHCRFMEEPELLLPTILSGLPQLTHLSVVVPLADFEVPYFGPSEFPVRHQSLTSLELVEPYFFLPANVMKMMPSLRSLALFSTSNYSSCDISSWLKDLAALSSLVVVKGPFVEQFVEFIPSSVTSLTLRPQQINSTEMTALSKQLPQLLHLHLEPSSSLGLNLALVPLLFPGLRSLRLRLQDVPEEALLGLAELKELQLLETQSFRPAPHKLVSRLRELTQGRVQVQPRPEPDQETCYCLQQLLRKDLQ